MAIICWIVRNPLLVEITLTDSSGTLQFFVNDPSPQSCRVHLLSPLFLKWYFLRFWLWRQYVLLQRHNVSEHLNSSLKRPGSLVSCFLCVLQQVLGQKMTVAFAVKSWVHYSERSRFHHLFFLEEYCLPSFPWQGLIEGVSIHFRFLKFVGFTKPFSGIVAKFQHSIFGVMEKKESNNFWFPMINLWLQKFNFV